MPNQFFSSLKTVAGSPYALIAYVLLLIGFVFLTYRRTRLTIISKALKHIPEKDRKAVLMQDYGIYLKEGMTASDYLKGQRQTYVFIFLLAVILMITIITIVALLNVPKTVYQPAEDQPDNAFCTATDSVMSQITSNFADIRGNPQPDGDTGDYVSKFTIPGTDRNAISLNPAMYFAWVYRGGDRTMAFKNYFAFVRKLELCRTDWVTVPGNTNQTGNSLVEYTSFVRNDHKIVVGVHLGQDSLFTTVLMVAKNGDQ